MKIKIKYNSYISQKKWEDGLLIGIEKGYGYVITKYNFFEKIHMDDIRNNDADYCVILDDEKNK